MRKHIAATIVAGQILACGWAANAATQEAAAPRPTPCSAGYVSKADAAIKGYVAKSKTPGVAVAFYDNGHACVLVTGVEGGKSPGPVTPQTVFALGSVQKVFNATLLAYQFAQGKATVDDAAAKYLVAADGSKVSPGSAFLRVTLRDLATHTSSLPRNYNVPGWNFYRDQPIPPRVMAYLNSWKPPYPPGTRYVYSNFAFTLLAYATTTLANQPHSKLLAETLTRPIGMTRTSQTACDSPNPLCALGHNPNGQPNETPLVGLWTNADDMLLFIEANLGVLRLPTLLDQAIGITHQVLYKENANHSVGMAWELTTRDDTLLFSKDGAESGFTSWLAFEPKNQRGVAVLSNGSGGPAPASLGQDLLTLANSR